MKNPYLHIGNTSFRKITDVKQLGPRLALGWVTIQGLEVDAVCIGTNNVKSQKRGLHYILLGKKSNTKKQYSTGTYIMIIYSTVVKIILQWWIQYIQIGWILLSFLISLLRYIL